MKNKALFLAFLFFLVPGISFSQDSRYTIGYSQQWMHNRSLKSLEAMWKFPADKHNYGALFGLSISGAKKHTVHRPTLKANVDPDLILDNSILIQLPQDYVLDRSYREHYYSAQIDLEYYYSITSGTDKIDWDLYISTGIITSFYIITKSEKYKVDVRLNDDQLIKQTISVPGLGPDTGLNLYLPACINMDIQIPTIRMCALISTRHARRSGGKLSFSFGF